MFRSIRQGFPKVKKVGLRLTLSGAVLAFVTAFASAQGTGCSGSCRSCGSCTAIGLMMVVPPLGLKFRTKLKRGMQKVRVLLKPAKGLNRDEKS